MNSRFRVPDLNETWQQSTAESKPSTGDACVGSSIHPRLARMCRDLPLCVRAESIASIPYNSMPPWNELVQFPYWEIQCCETLSDQLATVVTDLNSPKELDTLTIRWPWDVDSPSQLNNKIASLRSLSDEDRPIGLALPLTTLDASFLTSLDWLKRLDIDWICWRLPATTLGGEHSALEVLENDPINAAKELRLWMKAESAEQPLRPLPAIAIEFPWENGYQAAKAICAGPDFAILPINSKYLPAPAVVSPTAAIFSTGTLLGSPFSFADAIVPTDPKSDYVKTTRGATIEDFILQMRSFLALTK